jgi:hypothetical protein
MFRPPHPPRLYNSNYTWRRVQIMKLLVVPHRSSIDNFKHDTPRFLFSLLYFHLCTYFSFKSSFGESNCILFSPDSHCVHIVNCKPCVYQVIDAHTDISYQVAKEVAGGIISSRDFVILRHWGMKDNCFVSAGVSVKHPNVPPVKQYVRWAVSIASSSEF